MGVDTVTSGSSTSAVPPTDTGEAPVETGDEGSTTGVPPDESVPAEAAPEGTGEPEAPAEESPAEKTLSSESEYSTSGEPSTPTSPDIEEPAVSEAGDRASDDSWFKDMVAKAEAGDPKAIEELEKYTQAQATQVETAIEELKSRDEFSEDKKAEAEQTKSYEEALLLKDQNLRQAKKLQEIARTFPKDSPVRKQLESMASQRMDAKKKLNEEITHYAARREDAKTAEKSKQYQNLLQRKAEGLLTPKQQKQLAAMEKKFGSFRAGDAELYRSKTGAASKTAETKKGKADSQPTSTTTAQAKKAKEAPKTDEAKETVEAPSDEQVAAAEKAVGTAIPEDVRKERLTRHREKAALLAWSKENKKTLESGRPTGSSAMYRGVQTAAFGELESGKSGMVAGLRFLTGRPKEEGETVAANMETGAVGVKGLAFSQQQAVALRGAQAVAPGGVKRLAFSTTTTTFSGKREDVEKGMTKYSPPSTGFSPDLPIFTEGERPSHVPGVLKMWVNFTNRAEQTVGSMKLNLREIHVGR